MLMTSSTTPVDPDLLAILACPACAERPGLTVGEDESTLVCTVCSRQYAVTRHGYLDLVHEPEAPDVAAD